MLNNYTLEAIPRNYEKQGQSAVVDAAVQDCINDRASTDETLSTLKKDLESVRGCHNDTVEEFEAARRYSQATVALLSFAALAHAFPRINEQYLNHGTLVRADDLSSDPIAIGSRWLSGSLAHVRKELYAKEDPLAKHLEVSKKELNAAYWKWKATPIGQRSWPSVPEGIEIGTGDALLINVSFASDHLSAFPVYAAVYRGLQSPDQADDLISMTRTEAVPRIVWLSTVHRHLTRTKENMKLVAEGRLDEAKFFVPNQATTLLTYESIAQLGLEATVRKFTDRPLAQDPQFCPHASLKNGPLEKAWHCAGDVIARYSHPKEQAEAKSFFENMGLRLGLDGVFSPAFAITALMTTTHRDTLQPEWLKIVSGHYADIPRGQGVFEKERQRLLYEQS